MYFDIGIGERRKTIKYLFDTATEQLRETLDCKLDDIVDKECKYVGR